MTLPLAFLNGQYVPASDVSVAVDDLGFLLGVTVAERLRTFDGRLFRLDEHLTRLQHSLDVVGIELPMSPGELADVAQSLVERNRTLLAPGDDLGLTLFVTPGLAGRPGEPTVCLHTAPLPFQQWSRLYDTGQSLRVTPVEQVPPACWPAELKCRSRMHYFLAERAAERAEAGARALLLDGDGCVTEASTANIVLYRRAEGLLSPPREKILPGISVAVLAELAGKLAIPFVHRELRPSDVAEADEIMLTSTSPCVVPVVRFNGQPISDGQPGPVFQRLLAAWGDLVGVDLRAQAHRFAKRQEAGR